MDGYYFLKLLDDAIGHINKLCDQYRKYMDESSADTYVQDEEVLGHVQTAIGKGQLLINQKFKQFRGLCDKNIKEKTNKKDLKEGDFVTLDGDLLGFWEMLLLQVDDIDGMFARLEEMKQNNWKMLDTKTSTTIETNRINNNNNNHNNNNNNKNNNRNNNKRTTTANSNKKINTSNSTTTTKEPSASKIRADAARQRLIEAKKRAILLKKQEQLKEQHIQQEQQKNEENSTNSNQSENVQQQQPIPTNVF
jgi:hypothetical protein